MHLGKKKLQELKEKKISIEKLNDRYFVNSRGNAEVENILTLLDENVCNFKEIVDKFKNVPVHEVDKFKSIKDYYNVPCLYTLLENKDFFNDLMQNNRLTQEDLRYLLDRIDNYYEVYNLNENTILLKYIVDNDLFKELVDKFKNMEDADNGPCLRELLKNKELFIELIESNRLDTENLKYLLNTVDNVFEALNLSRITILLRCIVDNDIVSFKELADKFKSIKDFDNSPCLKYLLNNEKFFEELIQNNRLNKEDMRYLLNRIDDRGELGRLCRNTSLIKHILNEIVLSKETVDKLNTIIENDEWRKDFGIHTVFELIDHCNKNNEEILELNELNKYMYSCDFNEDQKLELAVLIADNEIAKNRLIQLIDNHLESNYDFESLMNYLKKQERKNLINI